jgi:hypothetical protein
MTFEGSDFWKGCRTHRQSIALRLNRGIIRVRCTQPNVGLRTSRGAFCYTNSRCLPFPKGVFVLFLFFFCLLRSHKLLSHARTLRLSQSLKIEEVYTHLSEGEIENFLSMYREKREESKHKLLQARRAAGVNAMIRCVPYT